MGEENLEEDGNNSADQEADTDNSREPNPDDLGSASRNGKRSITSPMTTDADEHQMKRLRSTTDSTTVSS